jgi:hypothetical protein
MVGVELSDQELESRLEKIKSRLENKQLEVVIVFDDNGNPYAMYTGFYMKKIAGWYVGATKIIKSANHYNQSAKLMAPGLDLLISRMEEQGLYKFWMAAPVWQHNIRNKVMIKYSPMLARYTWVDECLIPKNQRSEFEAFEAYRYICDWSDIMIRMFVLGQEYREQLVLKRYDENIKLLEQSRS